MNEEQLQALRAEHDELAEKILKKQDGDYRAKASNADIERFEQIKQDLAEAHGEPTHESDPPAADDVPDVQVDQEEEADEESTRDVIDIETYDLTDDPTLTTAINSLAATEEGLKSLHEIYQTGSREYRRAVNHYSQAIKHCQGMKTALENAAHETQQANKRLKDRAEHQAKYGC